MTRSRDYAYEALAEVTGSDMNAARGELNAALKSIHEQSEITDSYVLADEIHERAKLYRQVMPDVMLTPSALAKHWKRVFEETTQRKTRGTNLNAPSSVCATCGGDRFVVVALRPAVASSWMREKGLEPPPGSAIEEFAPCPACNMTADPSFHRFDGTQARAMDSAKVREMMGR